MLAIDLSNWKWQYLLLTMEAKPPVSTKQPFLRRRGASNMFLLLRPNKQQASILLNISCHDVDAIVCWNAWGCSSTQSNHACMADIELSPAPCMSSSTSPTQKQIETARFATDMHGARPSFLDVDWQTQRWRQIQVRKKAVVPARYVRKFWYCASSHLAFSLKDHLFFQWKSCKNDQNLYHMRK